MATPEYPTFVSLTSQKWSTGWLETRTFLMLGKAEEDIPAWNEDHVILKIFPLNLGLLHDDNIGLESVKHGLYRVS